ncbi:MAG: hypothetical protein PHG55_01760 [Verrucomicrobiota bacterium]|nr:hypothetical protein [Verrucomicrobiota bacterium]
MREGRLIPDRERYDVEGLFPPADEQKLETMDMVGRFFFNQFSSGRYARFRMLPLAVVLMVLCPGRVLAEAPKVLAFYYTWYGTPEVSGQWKHWNEGGHDPEQLLDSGLPDTGTTQHPAAGLYDSHDRGVIRRHLQEARQMGIDALISTWWRQGDDYDRGFRYLLEQIQESNSPLQACAYLELAEGTAGTIADIRYLLSEYGSDPGYLRDESGRPVIFVYSRAMASLSSDQWGTVAAEVGCGTRCLLIADGATPELLPVFGGNHWYNPVTSIVGGLDMRAAYADFVQACEAVDALSVATIIPGYDDSNIGRATPIVADREDGRLYMRSWAQALASGADWIAITSFNEWHEGSEIEASSEHGTLYGTITAHFSRFFHDRAEGALPDSLKEYMPILSAPDMLQVRPLHSSLFEIRNYDSIPVRVGARNLVVGDALALVGAWLPEEKTSGLLLHEPAGLGWPVALCEAEDEPGLFLEIPPFGIAQIGDLDALLQVGDRALLTESGSALLDAGLGLALQSSWSEQGRLRAYDGAQMPLVATLANLSATVQDVVLRIEAGADALESAWSELPHAGTVRSDSPLAIAAASAPAGDSVPMTVELEWTHGTETERRSTTQALGLEPPFDVVLQGAPIDQPISGLTLSLKKRFAGAAFSGIAIMPNEPKVLFPVGTVAALSLGADEWTRELVFPISEDPRAQALRPPVEASFHVRWNQYEATPSAIVFLGGIFGSNGIDFGLRCISATDGEPERLSVSCRMTPNPFGSVNYLYFDAVEGTAPSGRTYIVIDYVDKGQGLVTLQYDSTDFSLADHAGAYKVGPSFTLTDSGDRKRFRATVEDMHFGSRQNAGADFRLVSDQLLEVERIMLRKW